jgi:hypothetical protein
MAAAEGKNALYRDRMYRFSEKISHTRILRTVAISHADAFNLILMGPNARHLSEDRIAAWYGEKPVTFDVELLTARA